jgi:hypothetical protein
MRTYILTEEYKVFPVDKVSQSGTVGRDGSQSNTYVSLSR